MRHARFLLAGVGAALVTAACGGKVVVDLTGNGGSTSTTSSGTGGTSVNVTAVTGTAASSTGGVGCVSTCAQALAQGGAVCSTNGLASMNYTALYTCGCGASVCAAACNFSLCTGTPLDMECAGCLGGACAEAFKSCEGS
jgi:hypothetical protein